MRQAHECRRRRAAFTLVELLVVILIIAILFSLAAGAVIKALGKADEVRARSDITQLANAVQAFKTQFQVSYVPDTLILPPGLDTSGASVQYISSLFPRINAGALSNNTTATFTTNSGKYTILTYWGVTGQSVLYGDQCLVFFLGGRYQANSGCTGFATDPTDPMHGTGTTSIGPFFDFPPNRLVPLATSTATYVGVTPPPTTLLNATTAQRALGFPSYVDVFGTNMPYFYFSSRQSGNDYQNVPLGATPTAAFHRAPSAVNLTNGTPAAPATSWIVFSPYQLSATRFASPNSFQIVCAGRDGCFGGTNGNSSVAPGGQNWAGFNSGQGSADQYGYDNYSNFHPIQLGIPAQ
jgi:prepilin-type N-terminal cleavage/methylation domain-containing protein